MIRGKRLSLLLAGLGSVAFLCQGYDQALMNGIIVLENFVETFPALDTVNTSGSERTRRSDLSGTTVAIYEVGCAIGALSCFWIGDVLGRRRVILLACSIVIIGVILQSTPFQLAQLIVARVVTGLGVGALTVTVPMWVGECSKAHNRGKLVMIENSMAIGGVFLVTWIELGLFFVKNNAVSWRFPIALQSIFPLAVLCCIWFMPESPRWLVAKGRRNEAAEVLSRLDDHLTSSSDTIQRELAIIERSLEAEHGGGNPNPFAMTDNKQRWRTFLALAINILAQMTGVNIISFYSDTIFTQLLGYDDVTARIITGCIQTWQFICATSAIWFIEKAGRRKLLLWCSLGMAVSQAGSAGLLAHPENKAAAGASLVFDFLALFCFPVGLFVITFLYTAEIAPLRVRAKITAMGGCANWLFNFLLAEITPHGFNSIGWKYYLIYVCTSLLCTTVVYFFAPETQGRSLEDIDNIFIESNSIFDPVKLARRRPLSADEGAALEKTESITVLGKDKNVEHV